MKILKGKNDKDFGNEMRKFLARERFYDVL
jgi:hypothetical protein